MPFASLSLCLSLPADKHAAVYRAMVRWVALRGKGLGNRCQDEPQLDTLRAVAVGKAIRLYKPHCSRDINIEPQI